MCRVAALNQAWFEWEAHSPLLIKTGVLDDRAVESLKEVGRTPGEGEGLDDRKSKPRAEVMDRQSWQEDWELEIGTRDGFAVPCI